MTHKLSEAENQDCRHHLRGSVRRASGFVLTGKPEVTNGEHINRVSHHRATNRFCRRLTWFVRCTCRFKRTRVSHLLFDRFQHSPGGHTTSKSDCGRGCDGCAGDQCTGTSNSADEAPATRLLLLRPTRRHTISRLSVSTGRAWIREAKRQST